jgi:V8-like Glu-specific endopeptidase
VRPAVLLPVLVAVVSGIGAVGGTESPRAPVAVRAPLSADVLRAMARGRLSAEAALADYWTTGRMRAADHVPAVPVVPPVSRRKRTPPVSAGTGQETRTGAGAIGGRAVGKVFFRNAANGQDYSCSAAAVDSPSRSLISTAGHCVDDGRGTWQQNWVFVPSFDRGRRPYGLWRAKWLATLAGWAAGKESGFDVAFVKVAPADGRSLVDVVGGEGIHVGAPSRTRPMTIVGYPFLPPYPGDRQYFCQGTTRPDGRRLRMACPLTTGASGGPWLEGYDTASGRGLIGGVTTNTDLGNTTLWSPDFDDGVGALYRWADRL